MPHSKKRDSSQTSYPDRGIAEILEDVKSLQQELSKRTLLDFIAYADQDYEIKKYHRLIAEELEAVAREQVDIKLGKLDPDKAKHNRLVINLPPRHGKSRLCSIEFPAWVLSAVSPDLSVILGTYAMELSGDLSRKARARTVEALQDYKNGLRLNPESSAVDRWSIEGHIYGGLIAAGIGGPINGRGGNILILDDPYKNWEEANSATMRKKVADWYKSTFYTRQEKGAAIIVLQTRWHEDDLSGELLTRERDPDTEYPEGWRVLNIPAVSDGEGDPLKRPAGDTLWPEKYSSKRMSIIRNNVGPYIFNALYQGRPQPASGTMFKRKNFRYWSMKAGQYVLVDGDQTRMFAPEACWHFQTCDPAGSVKTSADYFVLSTWICTPQADLLLYDVQRLRIEGAQQPALIMNSYQRYAPSFIGVEGNGIGKTLFQTLKNAGLPMIELRAETDKIARSLPVGAKYEAGKVFHRSGAEWIDDWENELLAFPKGKNDDQVDTASYAGILVAQIQTMRSGDVTAVMDLPMRISPI